MRADSTLPRPSPQPTSTAWRFFITWCVCASIPSGYGSSTEPPSNGIWPVTKTQPSASTAWLKGATGSGAPATMWKMGGTRPFVIAPERAVRESVHLGQLIEDGRVLERRDVLRDRLAAGHGAKQPPHDLAAACLRQVVAESDVLRLGDRTDFLRDPVAQFLGDLFRLLAGRARPLENDKGADRFAGGVVGPTDDRS